LYTEKAAMELMGTWEASTIGNENPDFAKKLGFFAFPSVPDGKGDPSDLLGTLGDNFISVTKACPEKDKAVELIKFLTDDTAAAGRVADSRLPPIKNLKVDNPFLQDVAKLVSEAKSVQLWWDQELPPKLGELHKDTSQALFGLSKTPEQVAEEFEAAAKAELK
ncbi:MAG: transporter substrate-binding protein, partial [Proteobacteria bacterium]|nr:transporter substrate-binding protein [Pseudomonadota bacterium]